MENLYFLSVSDQDFDFIQLLKISFGLSSSEGNISLVVTEAEMTTGVTSATILSIVRDGAMAIVITFLTHYVIK